MYDIEDMEEGDDIMPDETPTEPFDLPEDDEDDDTPHWMATILGDK